MWGVSFPLLCSIRFRIALLFDRLLRLALAIDTTEEASGGYFRSSRDSKVGTEVPWKRTEH